MTWRKLIFGFLILSFLPILLGNATAQAAKVNNDNASDIQIGWRMMNYSSINGYLVYLGKGGNNLIVNDITKETRELKDGEELMYINTVTKPMGINLVFSRYPKNRYGRNDASWYCSPRKKKGAVSGEYGPCDSRLMKRTKAFNSYWISLNPKKISKVVKQLDLIDKIKQLQAEAQTMALATNTEDQASTLNLMPPDPYLAMEQIKSYNLSLKSKVEGHRSIRIQNFLENVELILVDQSGFYNNELDFKSMINISVNFEHGRRAFYLNEYNLRIGQAGHSHNEVVIQIKKEMKTNYDKTIDKTILDVSCPPSSSGLFLDYQVDMDCPVIIKMIDLENRTIIPVTINSKNFGQKLPQHEAKDSFVKYYFDGKLIWLENLTKEYLRVEAISVYHNEEISTFSPELDLPPYGKLTSGIRPGLTSEIIEQSTYNRVTRSMIDGKDIKFGVALKYFVTDGVRAKTLYDVDVYSVSTLLGRNGNSMVAK